MKKILVIVLSVILTLTLLLTSGAFAGGGDKEVIPAQMVLDVSLSEVSTNFGTPKANLEVARSRAFNFGADKFLLSSIVDKKSKQAYMVSTDAQGKVWIAEPKIEKELIDHMSQTKPVETVTVSIWAIYVSPEEELRQMQSKYPDVPFEGDYPALEANVSPEVLDAIEADMIEIKLKANKEAVQPVVDFLQSTGGKIVYISKYAPTVDAELSKEDVYKLARLPEVKSISLPPGKIEPCMNTAAKTIKADDVWDEGYDGGMSDGSSSPTNYQTKVAVIDTGIDWRHPCLEHAYGGQTQQWKDYWPEASHGTWVAGCLASMDPEGEDEDFEWGSDGTPLSGSGGDVHWFVETSGKSVAEIDTSQKYSGTRSARIFWWGSNPIKVYRDFRPKLCDHLGFYFKKDMTACADIILGNGISRIVVRLSLGFWGIPSKIQYYDGTYHDTGYTISSSNWYFIELRNIDWGNAKYDIYVNGGLVKGGATMGTHSGNAHQVCFQSGGGWSNIWIDDIRDYVDNRGIAYGTAILDGNFNSLLGGFWSSCKNACDWAHNNGADVYNLSWNFRNNGTWDNDYCEYFDHIAYEWDRLPVCAAGNDGLDEEYVCSPANAWNVLAVGGINDDNSKDWTDDTIANFSSWRNPETPHGDREKPEVCAPADGLSTTKPGTSEVPPNSNSFEFENMWGTSFAAPQVAGIAALLIEKNNSLRYNPALLKAIIMASANHNVEPDDDYVQWGYDQDYFPNGLEKYRPMDDKEGVGTVNAAAAYECVDQGWMWSGNKVEADLPFDIPFYAAKGEKVRFVITWYAHTTYEGWTDYELCADLNLEIVGGPYYPYWPTWYSGSISDDSAWEIVQFTAPYTGNYYARVSADTWTYNAEERIAVAWYRWNDDDFEWGSDGTNLGVEPPLGDVDWTVSSGGSSVAEIDIGQACSGTKSARFYRPAAGGSVYACYPKFQPDCISFCLRKEGDACADIIIGNGEHRLRVRIDSDEKILYYDNTGWQNTTGEISVNTWYLIEFRNIDWDDATYDICMDRYKFKSGASMQTYSGDNGYIMYGSEAGSGNFWIDNVS